MKQYLTHYVPILIRMCSFAQRNVSREFNTRLSTQQLNSETLNYIFRRIYATIFPSKELRKSVLSRSSNAAISKPANCTRVLQCIPVIIISIIHTNTQHLYFKLQRFLEITKHIKTLSSQQFQPQRTQITPHCKNIVITRKCSYKYLCYTCTKTMATRQNFLNEQPLQILF